MAMIEEPVQETELQRKRRSRQEGITAAKDLAKVAGDAPAAVRTAAAKRKAALKASGAEGLAAAVGGTSGAGLGARAAAAQEIAKKTGIAAGAADADAVTAEQKAKEDAATAKLDLTKYKREAGSGILDVRKRRTELAAQIATLEEEQTDWSGDDEDAFATALLAKIKDDPPEIRDAIIKQYREHSNWNDTNVWESPEALTSDGKAFTRV